MLDEIDARNWGSERKWLLHYQRRVRPLFSISQTKANGMGLIGYVVTRCLDQCPLLREEQTTYPPLELFRF
jgi:hypothetical protein